MTRCGPACSASLAPARSTARSADAVLPSRPTARARRDRRRRSRADAGPAAPHVAGGEERDRPHPGDERHEHEDLQRAATVARLGGLVARVGQGDDVLVGRPGLRVLVDLVVGAAAGAVVGGGVGLLPHDRTVGDGVRCRPGGHGARHQHQRGQCQGEEDGDGRADHRAIVRRRPQAGQTRPSPGRGTGASHQPAGGWETPVASVGRSGRRGVVPRQHDRLGLEVGRQALGAELAAHARRLVAAERVAACRACRTG